MSTKPITQEGITFPQGAELEAILDKVIGVIDELIEKYLNRLDLENLNRIINEEKAESSRGSGQDQ